MVHNTFLTDFFSSVVPHLVASALLLQIIFMNEEQLTPVPLFSLDCKIPSVPSSLSVISAWTLRILRVHLRDFFFLKINS